MSCGSIYRRVNKLYPRFCVNLACDVGDRKWTFKTGLEAKERVELLEFTYTIKGYG